MCSKLLGVCVFFFFKAACARTRRGQRGRGVPPQIQRDLADRRGDQHQLHGNAIETCSPYSANARHHCRCLIPRVHLSSAQLEKAGDVVTTPPLDLTITYPYLSPRENYLLYLTHVSTKPKVCARACMRPKVNTYSSQQ